MTRPAIGAAQCSGRICIGGKPSWGYTEEQAVPNDKMSANVKTAFEGA